MLWSGDNMLSSTDTLDVIDHIQRVVSPESLLDLLGTAFGRLGFDRFIISGLPHRGVDVRPFVMLNAWPRDWFEHYTGNDYVHLDPVARHCFHTVLPFEWGQAPYDAETDPIAHRIMKEAEDSGMPAGFCIPVHMEDGMQGCVSLAAQEVDIAQEDRLMLHLIALYAHGRLRFLKRQIPERDPPKITGREAEVLKWAAVGKSNADIAEILGISPRTVVFHFESIARRMGTLNRTHSVAEALRYNLISL